MILSGRDLQWYLESDLLGIDPITPEQFQQNGIDFIIEDLEHKNDKFYLGVTRETIQMPNDLMAFVEVRSSWAREGFILPPTIIDAGFKGSITLEILHFGLGNAFDILGKRFAHIIFARLTNPTIPYNGKYQHQQGITESKKD